MSSEAYGAFAWAYDLALGERFFQSIRKLIDAILEEHPTPKRTHLDLACGTGLTLQHFERKGWKSIGVDASLTMLQLAARRSGAALLAADMRSLALRRRFARITCLYDSLNHLLELDDLTVTFKTVASLMDADSLFLFDMNHADIYPEVWGAAEPFVGEGAGYRLEIVTSFRKREKLARAAVRGWAYIDNRRIEISEHHRQRAYSEREIATALRTAGLVPLDVIDFDPYDEQEHIEARTVKLFFVCRRG